jgi:hypothetical protein
MPFKLHQFSLSAGAVGVHERYPTQPWQPCPLCPVSAARHEHAQNYAILSVRLCRGLRVPVSSSCFTKHKTKFVLLFRPLVTLTPLTPKKRYENSDGSGGCQAYFVRCGKHRDDEARCDAAKDNRYDPPRKACRWVATLRVLFALPWHTAITAILCALSAVGPMCHHTACVSVLATPDATHVGFGVPHECKLLP